MTGNGMKKAVVGDGLLTGRLIWMLAIIVSVLFGGIFAWMNYALHENRLWFSAIKEVEREISLRTECGLYYSYYKQIINTTEAINGLSIVGGFVDAVRQLSDDRRTEAPNSINIIRRFNIFQEILLAALYRVLKSTYVFTIKSFGNLIDSPDLYVPEFLTPIFFYTYACFVFAGLAIFAVYWLTLSLCDDKDNRAEWSAGLLAVAWLFYNLEDASRVYFTLNLRENFAFPLFWLQNYYVICALHNGIVNVDIPNKKTTSSKFNYFLIFLTTLLFSAFWQFNQFILTLQSTGLFAALILVGYNKCTCQQNIERSIYNIIVVQTMSFLVLIGLQGFQPMLITAISVQFNLSILVSIYLMNHFFESRRNFIVITIIHIFTVFAIVILFTLIRRLMLNIHSDDSHIWEFAQAKIGRLMRLFTNINSTRGLDTPYSILELADVPFESTIYLCHGAFAFLDLGFFDRTSKSGLFPLYMLSILSISFVAFRNILTTTYSINAELRKQERQRRSPNTFDLMQPTVLYFSIQSILSGVMAFLMLRLKYLWLPQMAVISAFFGSKALDTLVGRQIRTVVVIAISAGLLSKRYEMFRAEISIEQEFYDPNTVELMNWISHNTPPDAIFTGSMQLMAGVKCCSNRPIANHPHFEDKILRQRTQRLYQIYAKKSPEEVYNILRAEKIDYIVVEESICFIPPNGCSTGELMDLVNRHVPAQAKSSISPNTVEELLRNKGFKSVSEPRFCEKVREFGEQSSSMFKLALQNRTFRVYKVL